MSTELFTLHDTGSRGVDMTVNSYCGGKAGVCIQLRAIMAEGRHGYVQLKAGDLKRLSYMLKIFMEEANDEQGR